MSTASPIDQENEPKIDYYLSRIKGWGKELMAENALKICVSRKAPRLLEVLKEKYNHEPNFDTILNDVISEHAIPFVFPSYSEGELYKKHKEVLIGDDAIFNGSTVERIKKITAYAKALFFSEHTYNTDDIRYCTATEKPGRYFMTYYTHKIVSDFMTLGKSFDMEYPILYFSVREGLSAKQVKASLDQIFGGNYITYSVVHLEDNENKELVNFTVLISDKNKDDKSVPEFHKLRIYYSPEKRIISITSFALFVIPQDFLTKDSLLFKNTSFEDVWKEVVKKAKFISWEKESTYSPELKASNMREEYNYHVARSINIWANYLLAFSKLLEVRTQINSFIQECGGESEPDKKLLLGGYDLALLIGPELASEVKPILVDLFCKTELKEKDYINDSLINIYTSGSVPLMVIPEEYQKEYNQSNLREWPKCINTSELMSSLFHNIHYNVENKAKDYYISEDRLKFGVSVSSMYNDFMYSGRSQKKDERIVDIHRSLDKKIDEGSIVPKYVRVRDGNGLFYWRRLCRASENDDKFRGQLFRIFLYTFSKIQVYYGSLVVPHDMVESALVIILGNIRKKKELTNIGRIAYDFVFHTNTSRYRLRFHNGNNVKYPSEQEEDAYFLMDYMLKYDLVISDNDRFTYATNERSKDYHFILGSSLETQVQNVVEAEAKFAIALMKKVNRYDFLRMMNIWNASENEAYSYSLQQAFDKLQWQNTLKELFLEEEVVIGRDQLKTLLELQNQLRNIFTQLPDMSLLEDETKEEVLGDFFGEDTGIKNIKVSLKNRKYPERKEVLWIYHLVRLIYSCYYMDFFPEDSRRSIILNISAPENTVKQLDELFGQLKDLTGTEETNNQKYNYLIKKILNIIRTE